MRDINETLAALFQQRSDRDKDGVFHYLLREENGTLLIAAPPIAQWTPELLKNTLIIDIIDRHSPLAEDTNGEDEVGLSWISDNAHRASLTSFPVDTLLYLDDGDNRELVVVGSDLIARIDLDPEGLGFWIGPRDYFYSNIHDGLDYRTLPSNQA
jgi:hypothetical protein